MHFLIIKEEFFYKFLRQNNYNYLAIINYLCFKDDKLMLQIEKVINKNMFFYFIFLNKARKPYKETSKINCIKTTKHL